MGKNVAVFVDVANIFYAAKAAGVDIDYVTLLRSSTAGRDFVRAYAYTGLDPDNENQRNFHQFLARHNYKVVSKDIRKYGDGKVKANLDIELVVDMMKTARNLDVAVLVSGDGDFAPAIRAVQEMGVRVEVVSFRGNTSSDLIDVADLFTDITQIAKVEKGSTRSGRRVTEDDEDLSMTEVPDKQSEGTGESRGRGRGRTSHAGDADATRVERDERVETPVAACGSRVADRAARARSCRKAGRARRRSGRWSRTRTRSQTVGEAASRRRARCATDGDAAGVAAVVAAAVVAHARTRARPRSPAAAAGTQPTSPRPSTTRNRSPHRARRGPRRSGRSGTASSACPRHDPAATSSRCATRTSTSRRSRST